MVKLWALFGIRSESEPRPYFIGIYETLEAAALARAQAVSNSLEPFSNSMFYVKEVMTGRDYPYELSEMDD